MSAAPIGKSSARFLIAEIVLMLGGGLGVIGWFAWKLLTHP